MKRFKTAMVPALEVAAFVCCATLGCSSSGAAGTSNSTLGGTSSGGASGLAQGGAAVVSSAGATSSAGVDTGGSNATSAAGGSLDGGTSAGASGDAAAAAANGGTNAGAGGDAAAANGGTSSGASGNSDGGTSTGGTDASGGATVNAPTYPYILSCFNDAAAKSDLIIYKSDDALNWTLLYDTQWVGPTGFIRDPSIMRHTDGKYYVAATTPPNLSCCSDETSFAIASSSNLKDWTTIATVPCGVAGTEHTWSPEWFVDTDGSVHITATLDLKAYRYEPTDATLTKWSGPKYMGMSGTIDYQIFKIGSTYHAVTGARHATAPTLDGPWTFDNQEPSCKEGPAIVHISGSTWRYYCDNGSAGHEESALSKDQFQTWSSLATLPAVGNNISQGTVIRGDTGHPF